jgi:hypothetical protein
MCPNYQSGYRDDCVPFYHTAHPEVVLLFLVGLIVLFAVSLFKAKPGNGWEKVAMHAGLLLFSGGLYLLVALPVLLFTRGKKDDD